MNESQFKTNVNLVNQALEKGEPENIETYVLGGKEFTGYAVQSVIDAMNEIFGLDWWYEVTERSEIDGKDFWVGVNVHFLIDNGKEKRIISRGTQYGAGSALGSFGDSRKAAVSDALKKALAMNSIGNKPYQGRLEKHEKKEISPLSFLQRELGALVEETLNKNKVLTKEDVNKEVARRLKERWNLKTSEVEAFSDRDMILKDLRETITKLQRNIGD